MTKQEFIENCGGPLPGFRAVQCDCGASFCRGWRMEADLRAMRDMVVVRLLDEMIGSAKPSDLRKEIVSFMVGPVPGKSVAEMTPEERERISKWVREDPVIQEERIYEKLRKYSEQTAINREKVFP